MGQKLDSPRLGHIFKINVFPKINAFPKINMSSLCGKEVIGSDIHRVKEMEDGTAMPFAGQTVTRSACLYASKTLKLYQFLNLLL